MGTCTGILGRDDDDDVLARAEMKSCLQVFRWTETVCNSLRVGLVQAFGKVFLIEPH